jgi:peptide-methionine (S)-S-oxide reductase
MDQNKKIETAYFSGGCFWCLEAVFVGVKGVISSVSGFAGGEKENPSYEDVSSGTTGHAETVKIEFDSAQISYKNLLSIFFYLHDPTSLNRQGDDVGTQYRSAIFCADEAQKKVAEDFIASLAKEKTYKKPIVTEIKSLKKFYRAEEYHQHYFEKNPNESYCALVIAPKVEKFKKTFKKFYQD